MTESRTHEINLSRMWKMIDESAENASWIDLDELWQRDLSFPIRIVRTFHSPTGLDSNSEVVLDVKNFPIGTGYEINDRMHGRLDGDDCQIDIGQVLTPSNRISIEIPEGSNDPVDGVVTARLLIR